MQSITLSDISRNRNSPDNHMPQSYDFKRYF